MSRFNCEHPFAAEAKSLTLLGFMKRSGVQGDEAWTREDTGRHGAPIYAERTALPRPSLHSEVTTISALCAFGSRWEMAAAAPEAIVAMTQLVTGLKVLQVLQVVRNHFP